jgi:transposase
MTQKCCTERLLPVYIKSIQEARIEHCQNIILQDNDPLHVTRPELKVANQLKDSDRTTVLVHPAQSPDLNPVEAIWGILKRQVEGNSGTISISSRRSCKTNGARIQCRRFKRVSLRHALDVEL